jgi:hypothetical protein
VSEINKGTKKSIIPKFELSYFSSDFDAFFFAKISSLWVIDEP